MSRGGGGARPDQPCDVDENTLSFSEAKDN